MNRCLDSENTFRELPIYRKDDIALHLTPFGYVRATIRGMDLGVEAALNMALDYRSFGTKKRETDVALLNGIAIEENLRRPSVCSHTKMVRAYGKMWVGESIELDNIWVENNFPGRYRWYFGGDVDVDPFAQQKEREI